MGWRELSTDARHWDFWIRLFWRIGAGIVVSIIAGVYLGWWSYIWNLPTPLLVVVALVGTAAVMNIWLVTWALLTHYVKWPKTHPLQFPLTGDTKRSSSSTTKWTSDAERKAAASPPDDHAAPPDISDDEISITTKRDRRGALVLKLHNMEVEPKQRFSLLVTDLKLWSPTLNKGDGGFTGYPQFLQRNGKPLELIPSGGRADYWITPNQRRTN